MTLHFRPIDRPMRRHELIYVSLAAWHSLLATRKDLAAEPLVAQWVDKGWPLIGRRAAPGERPGVPLGLPLPPSAGKRRLSFVVPPEHIVSTAPPPTLSSVSRLAPRAWWPALYDLDELAAEHGVDARVFGSLAWHALTGLDYLTGRSDLDLLLHVHRDTDLPCLTAGIAAIEASAPMRVDGELIRDDGAAVNWREIRTGAREILVKSARGVALLDARLFLREEMSS
ncbi:MAG: malonate decarboxylase holo-[acyl-carrier-protein] synthase [Rhizomicrobium sp.]